MGLHSMLLLQLLLVALVSATTPAPETPQLAAKPGCPNKCGDLIIPYPFGIKDGCYLNEDFKITCNDSLDTPIAFLGTSALKVSNKSLEGQLTILSDIASDCYNKNGMPVSHNQNQSFKFFWAPSFTISNTQNKFVAIGCDTFATILSYQVVDKDSQRYLAACASVCNNVEYVFNESSCSGVGCCQISIPPKQWSIEVELKSVSNHSLVWDFNPCSYAFVVEERWLNFSKWLNFSNNSFKDLKSVQEVPMVVDWTIGNETSKIAQNNKTSYACRANRSTCNETDNSSGYGCWCSEGYKGNPYLVDGCQDIDECMNSSFNQCEKQEYCKNNEGNYSCHCPKGYRGDGSKDGEGCTPNPLLFKEVVLGVGISGPLLLLLGGFWLYKVIRKMRKIKLKKKFFKRNGGLVLKQQMSSNEGIIEKTKIFTSKELEKATDNFNQNRILGQGGQGTVYKGMLIDGRIVTIKKSKLVEESQLEQFINEVVILSQINHQNVVNLLGCCLETNVPLLVYEFVANGNLFELIHDQNDKFPFSWEMRLQIAAEVARAVAYLHSASSIPIYHRDIKSTNILLDDKYRAKVSDFGTSRSISIEQTHLTTLVHGTFGYLDPEYFQSSQFTEKSDVYSFGVVLVEVLTRQKPISTIRSREDKSLATYFILSLKENRLFDILDAQVMKEGRKKEIEAVANIAKRCLNLNGKKRPTMKEATVELEAIRSSLMPLNSQQNFEEDEYIVELTGPMDGVSVSVSSCSDHTGASSSDVHPPLYNKV